MLLNYHVGRFVLGSLCVGDSVRLGLSGVCVAGFSMFRTLTYPSPGACDCAVELPHRSFCSRNREQKTDVVIQHHSHKVMMMDILMSETC